jgi:hypothetical protein
MSEVTGKLLAQIMVNPSPPRMEMRQDSQNSTTDYVLASAVLAVVSVFGFVGVWLKKYFDTRLELSIARQQQEFANTKEDRDRSQNQADIFLTTTLSVIKEEKDGYLAALHRILAALEKIDNNQCEIAHQIIEIKGETASNTIRIANVQNTLGSIQGATQPWEGNDRRSSRLEY